MALRMSLSCTVMRPRGAKSWLDHAFAMHLQDAAVGKMPEMASMNLQQGSAPPLFASSSASATAPMVMPDHLAGQCRELACARRAAGGLPR